MSMVKLQELFLLKQQTSASYAYTDAAAESCAGTDIIEVMDGSEIEPDIQTEPIVLVAGNLDQDAAIPGQESGKGTLKFPMNPASSSAAPQWGKVLVAAAGFGVSTSAGTATGKYIYTPSNSFTNSAYLDHYTGNTGSSGALKNKFYNLKAGFKISVAANKVPTIEYSVEGAYHGQTDATQPSIVKARVAAVSFKNASITINGSTTYKLMSCDIDGGQTTALRSDPSEAGGSGVDEITNRKIKITNLKVYATTKAVVDPLAALKASTEGALTLQWGSSAAAIQISGTYFQITKCTKSDENGLTCFTMEGQLNRNDLTITVNPSAL